MTGAGFKVCRADSAWLLDAVDEKLVSEYITGIEIALENDEALGSVFLKDWIEFRKLHVTAGTCRVRHCDLLAFPQS